MKKILLSAIILAALFILSATITQAYARETTIEVVVGLTKFTLNGQPLQRDSLLYNGTAYLPAAYLAREIGLETKWEPRWNRTDVTFSFRSKQSDTGNAELLSKPVTKKINVTFGAPDYYINGKRFEHEAFTYNGAAYLPASDFARKLGLGANWDPATQITNLSFVPATGINVKNKEIVIPRWGNYTLNAEIVPANTTFKIIRYTSGNEKILDVGESGVIYARSEGVTQVTLTSANGITQSITVYVVDSVWETLNVNGDRNSIACYYIKDNKFVGIDSFIERLEGSSAHINLNFIKTSLNGSKYSDLAKYTIDDKVYYKLIDLADIFDVYYNNVKEDDRVINHIYTYVSGYTTRTNRNPYTTSINKMGTEHSDYGSIGYNYLIDNGNGYVQTLSAVYDDNENKIIVDTYDSIFKHTLTKKIAFEGEIFGCFYSGDNYNYIAFGNKNPTESNSKEVVRIVKYDKSFNRVDAVSINNCFTIKPFDFASPDMIEYGDTLVLHMSRIRYLSPDGLNHQSQLTIIVDTKTMTLINGDDIGEFQDNHVSHSFNQFVRTDGDTHVLIDHGDAYPRAVALNKYGTTVYGYKAIYGEWTNYQGYSAIDLLKIPGRTGDNYTGVSVGGFEISKNNYITAINSINFSAGVASSNYHAERDAIILNLPKNDLGESAVKTTKLTNYAGKNKSANVPYLVKISDDEFVVVWQEIDYNETYARREKPGVKWAKLDGVGNLVGEIQTVYNICLSDCQPIYKDGNIIWFVNDSVKRMFFKLPVK